MTKKDVITIVCIVIALFGLWFIFSGSKQNDETLQRPTLDIQDNLYGMNATTTEAFNKAMQGAAEAGPTRRDDKLSDEPFTLLGRGLLVARAFNVTGAAILLDVGGDKILRFEGLESINGPGLRIYLASGLSNQDIVDLGAMKATHGNINYAVPADIDTAKYPYILVWSEPFGILFSYADLTQKFTAPMGTSSETPPW